MIETPVRALCIFQKYIGSIIGIMQQNLSGKKVSQSINEKVMMLYFDAAKSK